MGTLTQAHSGAVFELSSRCLVGRAETCDFNVDSPGVSSQHATLAWDSERWTIRDLGSRNGTTVDDRPVPPGQDMTLGIGAVIRFGGDTLGWTLTSAAPPAQNPTAYTPTRREDGSARSLNESELAFRVSRDEEHCELTVRVGLTVHALGARAHHYTLLTLARQRLEDAARGDLHQDEEGWLYTTDLADMLGIDVGALNVQIHRARKALEALEIEDAADLVERRPSTGQLRIGPSRLRVTRAGE